MFTKKIDIQILFIHEFLTFLKAGVSLIESLDFLRKQSGVPQKIRRETDLLYQDVSQGSTLADSLRRRISFLDPWQFDLIEASEKSGTLKNGFTFIAAILETKKEHLKKMILACMHPTFYTIVFIVFYPLRELIGLLIHRQEAYLTAYLMVQAKVWIVIASVFFFFKLMPVIFQSKSMKVFMDGIVLWVPFLGKAIKHMFLYQFFYVFGSCYASGNPVLQSWELASQMCNNRALAKNMKKGFEVLKGQGDLDTAFFITKMFPEKIINLIRVGLKSGTMKDQSDQCMKIYYEHYEMDAKKIEVIVPKIFYFIMVFLLIGIIMQLVRGYTNTITNLVPFDQSF